MGRLSAIFILAVGLCIIFGPLTADSNLAAAEPKKDFKELIGRWIRNDAGYVIEIKSIDAEGKMEAGYYNPRPIYVSVAKAIREKTGIKIFIELRDVGYPGSTYTLVYVPQNKVLVGFYYQAGLGQNFDVLFTKMK
jgi:hypothetical protein